MSASEEVTPASDNGARPKTSGYSTPGEGSSTVISVAGRAKL